MASSKAPTVVGIVVLLAGVIYQFLLRDLLVTGLGIGRVMQPLSDFPYACRRVYHPQLQGCEDMWLDDEKRVLYAACSSTADRMKWIPAFVSRFLPRWLEQTGRPHR